MKKYLSVTIIAVCAVMMLLAQKSGNSPTLFAEGVINTSADEYNPAFTPDGKTIFYTRRVDRNGNEAIMYSRLENGKWTTPQTAEFSGKFYDKEPFVSLDGKRLFFASTRPNGRDAKGNFDIWMVEKTGNGWSEAKNLGANVNSSSYDNYPSVAADGTLYFASVRIDGRKDNDLYRSRLVNGEYQKAESLGEAINTNSTEADPFIAPDQSYLIVCSDRPGSESEEGDLYVSFNERGAWTQPQSLGKIINTADYEYTPLVFKDKFYFSRGWGDIFEMPLKDLNLSALRQTPQLIKSETKFEDFVGEYEIMPNLIFTVTLENGKLFGAAKGNKLELTMIGENRFATEKTRAKMIFVRDSGGKVGEIILTDNGSETRCKKIK